MMNNKFVYFLILSICFSCSFLCSAKSTRAERRLVSEGNRLYKDHKYKEAAGMYEDALKENPTSASARYNLGISQIRQVTNPQDTSQTNRQLLDMGIKNLTDVGRQATSHPGIAAKAWYNLGNLEFNVKEYEKAINYYKDALRIDPDDENARRNLRIAQKQLKQQKQQQNQNQDQQKENQEKEKDKDKQQNNQEQNQQDKQQKQDQKENKINQQTAERILQAVDNKENQTRARVNRASKGEGVGSGYTNKKW